MNGATDLNILVTGGAGFIGSAVCRHLVRTTPNRIINLDKLTYAGNLTSLREVDSLPNYHFIQADICDEKRVLDVLRTEKIDIVMNLAAESHVDRSIDGPAAFITTNVVGTFSLLSASLTYWREQGSVARDRFRFHHISTDEVFGDLPFESGIFDETTPYAPTSPYSASKASSDHLVRAWYHTYGLPVLISNCSNNYGPYHFPEKLIPLTILNALAGRPLPVYGQGANVRDWLFVEDHARALAMVALEGAVGECYAIGGRAERSNIDVVNDICRVLDERRPRRDDRSHSELITFVDDRPGHDRRYAIDPSKIERELGWRRRETFESGLAKTVDWYIANEWWWRSIQAKGNVGERLGKSMKAPG